MKPVKLVSISCGLYDATSSEGRDGDSYVDYRNIIYAIDSNGRLWSRLGDEWTEEKGPEI